MLPHARLLLPSSALLLLLPAPPLFSRALPQPLPVFLLFVLAVKVLQV